MSTHPQLQAQPTKVVPKWLHIAWLVAVTSLIAAILLLVFGFFMATPEENLAGVLLILAAILAVPLLVSMLFWILGFALRRQLPRTAFALVVISMVFAGLGVLLILAWFLPSIWV